MPTPTRQCSIQECSRKYFGKGYCNAHYQRIIKHILYGTWAKMHQRCKNPNATGYEYYGGRGIKVCRRWDNFSTFVVDMGLKPTPKHTLDRIDNDGNYEPGNCRWATMAEQSHNRRMTSKNTSGMTGVSWHKSAKKWEASITINYNKIYLGVFNTKEEAIRTRLAWQA